MLLQTWTNKLRSSIYSDVKYHSLPANGHANGDAKRGWRTGQEGGIASWLSLLNSKRRRLAIVGTALVLLILVIGGSRQTTRQVPLETISRKIYSSPEPSDDEGETPRPRYLRMLIPGSEANANLCKTIISGAVLSYPTPVLINWDKRYDDPNLIFGGSHIAKIEGVLAYLEKLDETADDDLVMLVDGYDVWFQLRPHVLIERYYEINKAANQRILEDHGEAVVARGVEQKVLFSAQKRCWPKEANHPACWAVPESSLAPDVYGNDTDTEVDDPGNPFLKYRQRYLNSGACIGPVKAVREIFKRAKQKMDKDKNIGSDQGIFAEIWGEQEYQRHVLKMEERNMFDRLADFVAKKMGKKYSYDLIDPDHKGNRVFIKTDPKNSMHHEFGIGLDYESKILQPTVFAEYDTEWISRDDRLHITKVSEEKGVPLPPRVGSLPDEVVESLQPFYSNRRGFYQMGRLPVKKTWNQVPLFTNIWSGISPVAVHHNAHRDGLKGRIQTHWPKPWFQPYLRSLLDERALSPQYQIAVTHGSGTEQTWYTPTYFSWENENVCVSTDNGDPVHFGTLCEGQWDELLRDGKGPWLDPRIRELKPIEGAEQHEPPAEEKPELEKLLAPVKPDVVVDTNSDGASSKDEATSEDGTTTNDETSNKHETTKEPPIDAPAGSSDNEVDTITKPGDDVRPWVLDQIKSGNGKMAPPTEPPPHG